MPSLIDLRRRIRAVKSTQQITKAMKMIAASRLKRAQDRVVAARPFAQRMLSVLNGLVSRVDPDAHPLLRMPDQTGAPVLLIVITADRGLCGSFNSNVIKAAGQFIATEGQGREVALGLIGRKGRDFFRRRGFDVRYEADRHLPAALVRRTPPQIANAAIEEFTSGRVGERLPRLQRVQVGDDAEARGRAAAADSAARAEAGTAAGPTVDYIFEPAPEEIFADLLPRHVQVQVYRALLESNAAFFAAQMTAMDAATRNSAEMIENLTLYMNKVRQAAITREIIEVVSGASAT